MALQYLAPSTKGTPQVLYSINISTKISGWKTEVHFATHFDEVFNVAFGEQTVVSWDYVSWNSYWTMLRNISARTNTHISAGHLFPDGFSKERCSA